MGFIYIKALKFFRQLTCELHDRHFAGDASLRLPALNALNRRGTDRFPVQAVLRQHLVPPFPDGLRPAQLIPEGGNEQLLHGLRRRQVLLPQARFQPWGTFHLQLSHTTKQVRHGRFIPVFKPAILFRFTQDQPQSAFIARLTIAAEGGSAALAAAGLAVHHMRIAPVRMLRQVKHILQRIVRLRNAAQEPIRLLRRITVNFRKLVSQVPGAHTVRCGELHHGFFSQRRSVQAEQAQGQPDRKPSFHLIFLLLNAGQPLPSPPSSPLAVSEGIR